MDAVHRVNELAASIRAKAEADPAVSGRAGAILADRAEDLRKRICADLAELEDLDAQFSSLTGRDGQQVRNPALLGKRRRLDVADAMRRRRCLWAAAQPGRAPRPCPRLFRGAVPLCSEHGFRPRDREARTRFFSRLLVYYPDCHDAILEQYAKA